MEGENGDELFVIQSGNVRITKVNQDKEILLNVLSLGEIFGEMAIIENKTRSSNAVAASDVILMSVTRYNLEFIVQNHPEIVISIFEKLADRLWLAYYQIANLFITDPEIKIYDAIYIQILKCRIQIISHTPCILDFTVKDILDFTGLAGQEGEDLMHEIIKNNSNLFINNDGKLACSDVSDILRRINIIKRDLEIKKNIKSSDYSKLL